MKSIKYLLFIILCPISLYAQDTLNHQMVTYITPVDNINIDGDLSDWPVDMPFYKLSEIINGETSSNKETFSAKYRIGYDPKENLLLLAVSIEDNQIVSSPKEDWRSQDSYSIYVDEQYNPNGSGVSRFTWTLNGQKELSNSEVSWDPESSKYTSWEKVSHSTKVVDGVIFHELALKLNEPIFLGRVIRLGHIVIDKDENTRTTYAGIRRGGKEQTSQPGRIGMVVFSDDKMKMGTLKGKVEWANDKIDLRPEGVRIISTDLPNFWMHLRLNRDDQSFQVKLPKGKYLIQPGMKTFFRGFEFAKSNLDHTLNFEVNYNMTTDIGSYLLKEVKKPNFEILPKNLFANEHKDISRIDESIQLYMDYYEIEGVSFLSFSNGKITYKKNYGFSNAYSKGAINDNTIFEVASITKPVVAFAALRLYEKGILALDKPLHEILPFERIKNHPYSKELTAKNILSHRSGLPNWPRNGELEFMFQPGTKFSYSGTAYQYLGRVLEELTGKDINSILQDEVCKPLGIEHFYFKEHPYVAKHKSHGHFNGFPGVIRQPKDPWIAGSLMTTAQDLLKFVRAINERKVLSKETYTLLLDKQIATPLNFRENFWGHDEYMGLGFFVEETPYGKVFKHTGNNGDFKAIFKIYDELNSGYILFSNGNTGHFIIENIEKSLLTPKSLK